MGNIFLVLFAVTLFVMYIAIRRLWAQTLYVGSIGAILSMVFVMLYALVEVGTQTGHAFLSGIVVGLGFAGAVVVIAVFFRANQPPADIRIVSETSQEDPSSGPANHSTKTRE